MTNLISTPRRTVEDNSPMKRALKVQPSAAALIQIRKKTLAATSSQGELLGMASNPKKLFAQIVRAILRIGILPPEGMLLTPDWCATFFPISRSRLLARDSWQFAKATLRNYFMPTIADTVNTSSSRTRSRSARPRRSTPERLRSGPVLGFHDACSNFPFIKTLTIAL